MRPSVHRVSVATSACRALAVGAACAVAMTAGALTGSAAPAQEATPGAILPAASCTIPPLTLPLFGGTPATALLATPAPAEGAALAPVDAATETAVRTGVAGILACLNTGDPTQTWAIFTRGYLARTFGNPETAYLPAFERALDAAPADPAPVYVIQSFVIDGQMADGRVVVALTLAAGDEVWADRLVLAEVDGRWLIDAALI